MASLKDIRIRIESTKNTQQITKAMKLVSAAKLRKAQHQITGMRPYALSVLKAIANIASTHRVEHPLLQPHESAKKLLLVVVSSDRGLCGSFNSSIIKYTEAFLKDKAAVYEKIDVFFMGRKAAEYFQKRKVKTLEVTHRLDRDISYNLAAQFAEKVMKFYVLGEYDEVRIIYNEFKSAISQRVIDEVILPVDLSKQDLANESSAAAGFSQDMIFEPKPEEMIEELLEKHFGVQVFRCMAESVASEHGARMTAMENATNNARDMLSRLTLTYNKARQEKITTELIEIVSGAEAL